MKLRVPRVASILGLHQKSNVSFLRSLRPVTRQYFYGYIEKALQVGAAALQPPKAAAEMRADCAALSLELHQRKIFSF